MEMFVEYIYLSSEYRSFVSIDWINPEGKVFILYRRPLQKTLYKTLHNLLLAGFFFCPIVWISTL